MSNEHEAADAIDELVEQALEKRSESREAVTASSSYMEEVGQTVNPEFSQVYDALEKRSERREALKDRPDIRELEKWVQNLEGTAFILQHLGADKSTRKGVQKQIKKLNKRINELRFDF
ncbi:hypothetical protein BJD55_gp133 [Gordonia phage Yvonnetastic]|uniref:Uncharacterized protein n=1 Tax=Gordonia phage Yvonnetastic TaxID=1821566 RepID=A0A142K950_9CAUD|nr:hypothetical protein BJD55_gp133 [Gordonia phage Yvonnetastic]AMS02633.1 hypothetical protein SEA_YVONNETASTIC_89 [Gordonia phage Yvonnetastic]WKW86065.1 hypothetical protein SEA_JONJAMES_91 [Gordonia Phage JonJames]